MVVGSNAAIPGQWTGAYELIARNLTVQFQEHNRAFQTRTDVSPPKDEMVEGKRDVSLAETLDLLNAIRTGGETRTPMIEGYRSLVLTARRSAETGRVVRFGRE
ncbi:MAG: hypothetical protein HY320_12350 [Armatimonadetes bacterium]|nr:hypothetical protein [Armatimonadota bacterium]